MTLSMGHGKPWGRGSSRGSPVGDKGPETLVPAAVSEAPQTGSPLATRGACRRVSVSPSPAQPHPVSPQAPTARPTSQMSSFDPHHCSSQAPRSETPPVTQVTSFSCPRWAHWACPPWLAVSVWLPGLSLQLHHHHHHPALPPPLASFLTLMYLVCHLPPPGHTRLPLSPAQLV